MIVYLNPFTFESKLVDVFNSLTDLITYLLLKTMPYLLRGNILWLIIQSYDWFSQTFSSFIMTLKFCSWTSFWRDTWRSPKTFDLESVHCLHNHNDVDKKFIHLSNIVDNELVVKKVRLQVGILDTHTHGHLNKNVLSTSDNMIFPNPGLLTVL